MTTPNHPALDALNMALANFASVNRSFDTMKVERWDSQRHAFDTGVQAVEAAIGSLTTPHPSPEGVQAELVRDAARYRHLRELRPRDNPPVDGSVWVVRYHQPKGAIPELRSAGFGEELDAAIDAERSRT